MTEFSCRSPHFHDGRELVIRQKLTASPDDAALHALLALDLALRGRRREAFAAASQAVRLDPDLALAHFALSMSLGWGQRDRAISEAKEAIRLDPQTVWYYTQLAHLYLGSLRSKYFRGPDREALQAAEAGLKIDPLNAWCACLRGLALQRLRRYKEADTAFRTALEWEPEQAHLHAAYGHFLFHQGKFGLAMESYREARRLAPDSPRSDGSIRLARSYLRLVDGIVALAARLQMIRISAQEQPPEASKPVSVVKINWLMGSLLWLVATLCLLHVQIQVGDQTPLMICLPVSVLIVLGITAFGRLDGFPRLVVGMATGFLTQAWLLVSIMIVLFPRHISQATERAWPHLHLPPTFYLAQSAGAVSAAGVGVFLIAAFFSNDWRPEPQTQHL